MIEKLLKMSKDELLEALKKLPPQERVQRIKELEEARKKELVETDRLKKASFEEISLEDAVSRMDVPKDEPVDLTKLFEGEKAIEPKKEDGPAGSNYSTRPSDMYAELRSIAGNPQASYEERLRAGELYNQIIGAERSEEETNFTPAARKIMKELMGSYAATNTYDPGKGY